MTSFASAPEGAIEVLRASFGVADDLPSWGAWGAALICALSLALLAFELRRAREARTVVVAVTSALGSLAMLLAIVRPQRVRSREMRVAPRVVVLVDRSRSMALTSTNGADGVARIDIAEQAARTLKTQAQSRVDVFSFGALPGGSRGLLQADSLSGKGSALMRADGGGSDLVGAMRALRERHDDPAASIVVVSDGRIGLGDLLEQRVEATVHAVAVGDSSPPDASIRSVRLAGAAVAHQPLPLRVEIACTGGLSCGDLTLTVHELREAEPASASLATFESLLATGSANARSGSAVVELPITLERSGTRAIEVSLTAPPGDAIADNDRRLLTIDVARERVRMLHVAGRPTFDVRALRTWLKSDAAIDVVSFFILRTPGDDVNAQDDDLALIPFPVRELFTEHLPTFDAVILQDFEADPYGLTPYLESIARYVEHGGGLVHIGGANAFGAGGYAGSPLARVTPVEIPSVEGHSPVADLTAFVPTVTSAGRAAPILSELAAVIGDEMPEFSGTSLLGDVRAGDHGGGVALWTHPRRTTKSGAPMPALAIADIGEGRSIALGVDSTDRLAFSAFAAKTGGRAYDSLYRGLFGWLMRDPRYEPVRARLVHDDGAPPCLAGGTTALRIDASPVTTAGRVHVTFAALESGASVSRSRALPSSVEADIEGPPPNLLPLALPDTAGGLAMRISVAARDAGRNTPALGALATRVVSVCEVGGDEWADPRPDRATLERLTKAHGGLTVGPNDLAKIPPPKVATVSMERTVSAVLPAWAWSAIAGVLLSSSWFFRRRGGLA